MSKYSPIDYNQFFENSEIDNIAINLLKLGDLNLSTGKIVACDPLVGLWNTKSFSKSISTGIYPVTVAIAKMEESGDRYAVVKLEFSAKKASKWELAISDDDDISQLKDDEYLGFPVDAGLGCFCDVETQMWYDKWEKEFMEKHPDGNIYDDFFAAEFEKNAIDANDPMDIGDWLNFYLPNKPDLNVIMFHSGYGDGAYPCYWGITEDEKVCSLVVDLQVL
jgi:hypothetical protein